MTIRSAPRPASAPTVGMSAPEVALRDGEGQTVWLADLWAGRPKGIVLVFLRHFG